jgi:hypothetical protein
MGGGGDDAVVSQAAVQFATTLAAESDGLGSEGSANAFARTRRQGSVPRDLPFG